MLDFKQASEIAETKLKEKQAQSSLKLVLLKERTIEFEYGWVYFYQSEAYALNGDKGKRLIGNAPFIIDKYTSEVVTTGTGKTIEEYVNEYCKKSSREIGWIYK